MFFVFVDLDAVGEGLVREPFPLYVGVRVEALAVHEEPKCSGDLFAGSLVLVVFSSEAVVDVREARSDAVLVALQGVEVDGVGEVGGEDVVGLGFQPPPVRSEFSEFVGAGSEPFVECGLDLPGEVGILGLVDRDTRVAVGNEAFRDRDGHGTAGATGGAFPSAGAGEVGVADALLVLR